MNGLALALWSLLAGMPQTPSIEVTVLTELDGDVLSAVTEHLERVVTDTTVRLRPTSTRAVFERATSGRQPQADMLFAIDVESCAAFALNGHLAPIDPAATAGVRPFYADPKHRIFVAFARLWVIAYRQDTARRSSPPSSYDGLSQRAWEDRIALPEPMTAPALWMQWMTAQIGDGARSDAAFAWVGKLDARVKQYGENEAQTLALLEDATVDVAVVPLDRIVAGVAGLDFVVPAPRIAVTGLAQAVVDREGAEESAVLAVYRALLAPELQTELAARGVLPAARLDGGNVSVPRWLEDARAVAWPVRPQPNYSARWFTHWEDHVRGKGQTAESVAFWLEIVFGLLFVLALWFVYTRSRSI